MGLPVALSLDAPDVARPLHELLPHRGPSWRSVPVAHVVAASVHVRPSDVGRRWVVRRLVPFGREMEPPRILRPELTSVLEALFGDVPGFVPETDEWMPRVDVEESDKGLVIRVDLPGVDPREIETSVEDGVLVIKGEKKTEKEGEEKNLRRRERVVGKFYRAMSLPRSADLAKINATSNRGVLTLMIPNKPEAEPHRISVHAEG